MEHGLQEEMLKDEDDEITEDSQDIDSSSKKSATWLLSAVCFNFLVNAYSASRSCTAVIVIRTILLAR